MEHEPQSISLFLGRRKDAQILDAIHPAIDRVYLAEECLEPDHREEYEAEFVRFFDAA